MNFLRSIIFLFSILIISCEDNGSMQPKFLSVVNDTIASIPNITADQSCLYYDKQSSIWTSNGQLFTGYMIMLYPDSTLKEKIGVFKGKKQNQAIRWYPDGHYKNVANYHRGKLHGEKKVWTSDTSHILVAHLNYHMGKAHGEQKQWYPTGELYKKLNLRNGKEEGIQQAYRENGELYANYEAKNGRTFGLKKAALCYGLKDENIRYED